MVKKIDLKEPLWEQQAGESNLNYKAFEIYREMGWNEELEPQKRSIGKVSERYRKSEALLSKWCQKFSWVKRAEAYDAHINKEKTEAAEKERRKNIESMRKRQRKAAVDMQTKGMALLDSIKDGDARLSEIVSLLKLGAEQERIAAGDTEQETGTANAFGAVHIYIPDNGRQKEE